MSARDFDGGRAGGVGARPTPAPTSDPVHASDRIMAEHPAGDPFAAAIRGTRMAMVVTDPRQADNPIVFANDSFLALTGYRRDEIVGRNCRFLQGPATGRNDVQRIRDAIAKGRDIEIDLLNYRKDGTPFWNALYLSPVRDETGEVVYFFGSQVDVTGRKAAEHALIEAKAKLEGEIEARTSDLREALAQKTTLLHEVDHRVKNNLQLISTLITLQARRIPDPAVRRSLKEMLERVTALSAVHRQLYQAEDVATFDVAVFLRELVGDLLASTGREDIAAEFDLKPAEVAAERAAPVALLVNELVTNALKHAFPEGRGGRLRVALADGDGWLHLTVEDDGVGRTGGKPGFGTTVIETLARQLRAKLAVEDAVPGVRVRLDLPAGHA